ncbi:unnamed protein product, partial [Urochloa humidicola]
FRLGAEHSRRHQPRLRFPVAAATSTSPLAALPCLASSPADSACSSLTRSGYQSSQPSRSSPSAAARTASALPLAAAAASPTSTSGIPEPPLPQIRPLTATTTDLHPRFPLPVNAGTDPARPVLRLA